MNNTIPADVLDKIDERIECECLRESQEWMLRRRWAIYGFQLRDDEVKELRKAVIEGSELHVNFTTYKEQLASANKRIEQLESALHKIMELADDGASLKLIYDGAEEALNK